MTTKNLQRSDLIAADRQVWGEDCPRECACGCGKLVDVRFSDYRRECEDRMMEEELGPHWRELI